MRRNLHVFTNEATKSAKKALLLAQIAGIISNVGEKKGPHPIAVLPLCEIFDGDLDLEFER